MTQEIEDSLVEALENLALDFKEKLPSPLFVLLCVKTLTEIAYNCAPCESEARSLILEAMLCARTNENPKDKE